VVEGDNGMRLMGQTASPEPELSLGQRHVVSRFGHSDSRRPHAAEVQGQPETEVDDAGDTASSPERGIEGRRRAALSTEIDRSDGSQRSSRQAESVTACRRVARVNRSRTPRGSPVGGGG
jgi:hypothetical protein